MRFSLDWVTRPVFGLALAAIAVGAIAAGTFAFAALTAVVSVAALREWHRIAEHGGFARELWISSASLCLALAVLATDPSSGLAWIVLGAATLAVLVAAAARGAHAIWQAGGVIYIGAPALLLTELRASAPHAPWVVAGLFLTVWATDTGALVIGNLVGGPKLWPSLSPNKTWAGTLGGVVTASVAFAIYIAVLGGRSFAAMGLAAILSIVAHAGDLFESWVKRQFKFKDSGGLIPGHGGALDRIDSTLAASTAMAFAVLAGGLDPTFGAHV